MEISLPNKISEKSIEDLEKIFREDLLPRRLYALFDETSCFDSLTYLSKALKCSVEEVNQALDILKGLQFIKFSNKGYVRSSSEDYKHSLKDESREQRANSHRERLIQVSNDLTSSKSFSDQTLVATTDFETYLWYIEQIKVLNDLFMQKTKDLKNKKFMVTSVLGLVIDAFQEGEEG